MIHKLILYVLVVCACVLAVYAGETNPVPYRIYRRGRHDAEASSSSVASDDVSVSIVSNPELLNVLAIAIDNTDDEEEKSYLRSMMDHFKTSGKYIIKGRNWEDIVQVVAASVSLLGESGLSLLKFNDPAGTLDGIMALAPIQAIFNNFLIGGFLSSAQEYRHLDLTPLQNFAEDIMIMTIALNQLVMQALPLMYGKGIEDVKKYPEVTLMHGGFLGLNLVQLVFKKREAIFKKMIGAVTFLRTLKIRRKDTIPVSNIRDKLLEPVDEVSPDLLQALENLNNDQCLGIVKDGNRIKSVGPGEYSQCPAAVTAADLALVARNVDSESGLGAIIADTSGNVFPFIILLFATILQKVLGNVNDRLIAISLLVFSALLEIWLIINSSMGISASLKEMGDKLLGREDPALRASIDNDLVDIANQYPEFEIKHLTKKGAIVNGLQMTHVSWWIYYDEDTVLTPSVRKPLEDRLKALSSKHRLTFISGDQFSWRTKETSGKLARRGLRSGRMSIEQAMSVVVESFESLFAYAENEREKVIRGFNKAL